MIYRGTIFPLAKYFPQVAMPTCPNRRHAPANDFRWKVKEHVCQFGRDNM